MQTTSQDSNTLSLAFLHSYPNISSAPIRRAEHISQSNTTAEPRSSLPTASARNTGGYTDFQTNASNSQYVGLSQSVGGLGIVLSGVFPGPSVCDSSSSIQPRFLEAPHTTLLSLSSRHILDFRAFDPHPSSSRSQSSSDFWEASSGPFTQLAATNNNHILDADRQNLLQALPYTPAVHHTPSLDLLSGGLSSRIPGLWQNPPIGLFADVNLAEQARYATLARSSNTCVNPLYICGIDSPCITTGDVDSPYPQSTSSGNSDRIQSSPAPVFPAEESKSSAHSRSSPEYFSLGRGGLYNPPHDVTSADMAISTSMPESSSAAGISTEAIDALMSLLCKEEQTMTEESHILLKVEPESAPAVSSDDIPLSQYNCSNQAKRRLPVDAIVSSMPRKIAFSFDTADHSPVLNAHQGVEMDFIMQKAAWYKKKYPGEDLSPKWLMAYCGKLSPQGALIEDFRCYVSGCSQYNRRRDHMLVHVGSHAGQRPFACSKCPMRFLRKNECKRHEASHSGAKPFSCPMCPTHLKKVFARQDLVKRHLRNTHGLDGDSDKENYEPRNSKRARMW